MVTQRSSVKLSMPALPPKRPWPESPTPPNGICGSSETVEPLTWQMPDLIWRATRRPRAVSLVKTDADSPYALSLASRIASSSSLARIIATTGPKLSSR